MRRLSRNAVWLTYFVKVRRRHRRSCERRVMKLVCIASRARNTGKDAHDTPDDVAGKHAV